MQYRFKARVLDVIANMFRQHSDRDLILHLIQRIEHMSKELSALSADVAANTSVVSSAVVLLNSLSAQLKDAIAAQANGDDGAALAALSTSLEANTNSLAQAVAANTPSVAGDSSASTPVHPATDLPGTPDAGSAAAPAQSV